MNIDSLLQRKSAKKISQFSLMLVGRTGLGKTTFVNTLFNDQVISFEDNNNQSSQQSQSSNQSDPFYATEQELQVALDNLHQQVPIKFISHKLEREEFGNKLNITIVDTPGFGESLSNEPGCKAILEYIEQQFDHVLEEESRIKRNPKFEDTRVHVLLYFIAPTGHSLSELDILFMKTVGKRVNIIPVIAKSDAFGPEELTKFKKNILADLSKYNIPVFSFLTEAIEDDPDLAADNAELQSLLPFALIGAEKHTIGQPVGSGKRGRQYQWGFVDVENPKYCDFAKLRSVLLASHFGELKDLTQNVLYENYRTEKLSRVGPSSSIAVDEPLLPSTKIRPFEGEGYVLTPVNVASDGDIDHIREEFENKLKGSQHENPSEVRKSSLVSQN